MACITPSERKSSPNSWAALKLAAIGNLLYYFLLAGAIQTAGAPLPTMIIGTLPVVIAGLALKDLIENQLRSLQLAAFMLIVFGVVLLVADRVGSKHKPIEKLTTKSAILFGLGQMLAVIPGVSRSGGTISARTPSSRTGRSSSSAR